MSLGAAGQRLGVSGGDIRRAGYIEVTVGWLEAWEHQPPAWLRRARSRKSRSATRQAEVSCRVCGTVRQARPSLVAGYTRPVRTLKEDLTRYRETGEQTDAPSLAGLRKRWNRVNDTECVDAPAGQVWWPQISKEAFADGIKAAVDAYWNWQASRAGNRQGRRVGFPRLAKKGRDRATGSPSPPARSGSNLTAGTSPCPGSAPSAFTRTLAAWSGGMLQQ